MTTEGKIALITGATRGLGLAISRKLCQSGYEVLLNYAGDESAAERAVRLLSGLGRKVYPVRADISSPDETGRLLDDIRRTHGRLDVFVHNAAVFHPMPAAAPRPEDHAHDRAVALNPLLHGVPQLVKLLPEGGRIIAISSTGAGAVVPAYVSLGIAKAGLESLVRYLAVELAPRGITVNAVAAGKLDKGDDDNGIAAMVAARTPTRRLTTPEEVADVVSLLCRPEAAAIHGQTITVDGGLGLLA